MIPIYTTTLSVIRPDDLEIDPYETSTVSTIATGIPANIGKPRGAENVIGGQQSDVQYFFACAPSDITHTDNVLDEQTNVTYEVEWVTLRTGLGLEHMEGRLVLTQGASNG